MAKYAVAGATGRVGSVVADELLPREERVTVIVRDTIEETIQHYVPSGTMAVMPASSNARS
jgi:putative NADH-flavin reductase